MVGEGLIDKKEAVLRVDPQQLDQLLHPVIVPESRKSLQKLAVGLPASPGAAVGKVVFTADDAVIAAPNGPVILVRARDGSGRYTRHGSGQGHRDLAGRHDQPRGRGGPRHGNPCVAGAGAIVVEEHKKQITVTLAGGTTVSLKEGDWVSLDGSTGEVYAGQAMTEDPDPRSGVLASFMGWADEFRGAFGVRANADIPRDAKAARNFGAEGIGLCRTEHMFFAEDRIAHMQAMIMAATRRAAARRS